MTRVMRFAAYTRPRDFSLVDGPSSIALTQIEVEASDRILIAMRAAVNSLLLENISADRFLLGSTSYLEVFAIVYEHGGRGSWMSHHITWQAGNSQDDVKVFDLPVSLDPSKPSNWVQCLPETNVRNATFRHLPANIGVSRGFAADDAPSIRSVLESVKLPEERKIILPDEAYSALAKVAVVTSYWDAPVPRKSDFEWNGENRKR